jgi:hypothetical protein
VYHTGGVVVIIVTQLEGGSNKDLNFYVHSSNHVCKLSIKEFGWSLIP